MGRYAPALVAVAILGVVGIAAAYGGGDDGSGKSPSSAAEVPLSEESTVFDPLATEPLVSAPEVEIEPESTDVPKNKLKRTLGKGTAARTSSECRSG
jgi:hypothetical protein